MNLSTTLVPRAALAALLATLALAPAQVWAQTSEMYEMFPQPAPNAFTVVGLALPNGRLVIWNGDALFLQNGVNIDRFTVIAEGYAGDPGFLALAPDGRTLLLGQGYFGNLYLVDSAQPQDFTPASIALNQSHYGGDFLTQTLVLLDVGRDDFSGSDLYVVDLAGGKAAPRPVVVKSAKYNRPKDLIVEKPPFAFSSAIFVDRAQGIAYVMDSNTRELRYFPVAALVSAFNGATTLDWETDGVLVGSPGVFFSGGVSGVTAEGYLVIGGSEGFLLPGGIQIVNPRLDDPAQAFVVETLDPAGTEGFYTVIFNAVTGVITAVIDGIALVPEGTLATLPAAGAGALTLLALALAHTARRRLR